MTKNLPTTCFASTRFEDESIFIFVYLKCVWVYNTPAIQVECSAFTRPRSLNYKATEPLENGTWTHAQEYVNFDKASFIRSLRQWLDTLGLIGFANIIIDFFDENVAMPKTIKKN